MVRYVLSVRKMGTLGYLADHMYCCQCKMPLHLSDTVEEKVFGQGSYLYIRCTNSSCQAITDVPTGKTDKYGSFHVTDKVVIGKLSFVFLFYTL